MNWYWTKLGGHTHVRVFMNGGKCGDLCFRNEEFSEVVRKLQSPCCANRVISFYPDNDQVKKLREEENERRTQTD